MRHEEKYICSDRQLSLIEHRLATIMQADSNQTGRQYHIRSLYFDTLDDRLYFESVDGVSRRRKYRIRFYNMNTDFFRMERKETIGHLKRKDSAIISGESVRRIINGEGIQESNDDVIAETCLLQQTEGLRPVAIVDYQRSAFIYPTGNIRVTLDRNIACSDKVADLLDQNAVLYPVMPYGKHILEVKYDRILPGFIASLMDIGSLERISFSKYANARDIINGNGRKEDGYEF